MSDDAKPNGHDAVLSRLWTTVITIYGPYAFGLASLLIIWLYIVEPQLKMQAIDFKTQEEAIDALREVNASQRSTADVLLKTAVSMEVVSQTLERTAEKLGKVIDGE